MAPPFKMLNFWVRILNFTAWVDYSRWTGETLRNKGYKIVNFRDRQGIPQVFIAKAPITNIEDYS